MSTPQPDAADNNTAEQLAPPFERLVVHVPHLDQIPFTSAVHSSSLPLADKERDGVLTRFRPTTPRSSLDKLDDNLVRRRSSRVQANLPVPPPPVAPPPPLSSSSSLRNVLLPAAQHDRPRGGLNTSLLNAVVRVTACICTPNYDLPWQMQEEFVATSTAFVIEGRRLLTVAHGVLFNTVVRVKKRSSDEFYIATVLCAAEECDLALLTVDDEEFWDDDMPALSLGKLPALQDDVTTVGYPVSGENICLTSGVTSRIEMQGGFLTIQIDAAINHGNSGGPAFDNGGKVVGVAFQKSEFADNQGFLIATDVVLHFLQDYDRHSEYSGSCDCGFVSQTLPSADIRRYLKMNKTDSGVLVVDVPKSSPAHGVVQKDDVVLSVDGHDISNTGSIPHVSGERLYFQFLIADKFKGDDLKLTILRNGNRMNVSYTVSCSNEGEVVEEYANEKKPEYYMIAGLVFMPMTEPYLCSMYGSSWTSRPSKITELLRNEVDEEEAEQYVLLTRVINHEINVDYSHVGDQRVHSINGTKVKSLKQLQDIVADCTEDFLRFDLDFEIIVLDRRKALEANKLIMQLHNIPSLCRIYERDTK